MRLKSLQRIFQMLWMVNPWQTSLWRLNWISTYNNCKKIHMEGTILTNLWVPAGFKSTILFECKCQTVWPRVCIDSRTCAALLGMSRRLLRPLIIFKNQRALKWRTKKFIICSGLSTNWVYTRQLRAEKEKKQTPFI